MLRVCCRVSAICLVALAFVPWGARLDSPVIVVALDGATLADLQRFGREGLLPHLSSVLSRSRIGWIDDTPRKEARTFWADAFYIHSADARRTYIWNVAASLGMPSAVVGVPGTAEVVDETTLVVAPGANEAEGFVGDNVGRFLDPSANVSSIGWPYDTGLPRARDLAETLAPGAATPWIDVEVPGREPRGGVFRMYRLADDWLWVSPIYRFYRNARSYSAKAPEHLLYVGDDPSWSWSARRSPDSYLAHEDDLAGARVALAAAFVSEGRKLVVYFDPAIALLEAGPVERAGERVDPPALEDAYRSLDRRMGLLLRSAADTTSVTLIGRPHDANSSVADAKAFWAVSRPSSTTSTSSESLRSEDVAPMIASALSIDRQGLSVSHPRTTSMDRALPLSPETLRELGLLSPSSTTESAGAAVRASTVSSAPALP